MCRGPVNVCFALNAVSFLGTILVLYVWHPPARLLGATPAENFVGATVAVSSAEDPAIVESVAASELPVTALGVLFGEETMISGASDGSVVAWFGVRASPTAAHWNLTRIREFERLSLTYRECAGNKKSGIDHRDGVGRATVTDRIVRGSRDPDPQHQGRG